MQNNDKLKPLPEDFQAELPWSEAERRLRGFTEPSKEPILRLQLNPMPQVQEKGSMCHVLWKFAVQRARSLDKLVLQEITAAALDAGITDLYILNEPFIVAAIREKMEREGLAKPKDEPIPPCEDDDPSIMFCGRCRSGEYLHNEDGARNAYCGQCGQKIDWPALDRLFDGEKEK